MSEPNEDYEYAFISPFTKKRVTHGELTALRQKNQHRPFSPFITPFDKDENMTPEIEEKRKKWIEAWKKLPAVKINVMDRKQDNEVELEL